MRTVTLSDIQTAYLLLGTFNPSFKKFYTEGLTNNEVFNLISVFNPNKDFQRYQVYKQFIDYAEHKSYCETELEGLSRILKKKACLEQQEVKDWIVKNEPIYDQVFGLSEKNTSRKATDTHFYLYPLDEYLEKKEFLPILNFCDVMKILYFKEYHKPASERETPDPRDYYYVPPTPQSVDMDKLKMILNNL